MTFERELEDVFLQESRENFDRARTALKRFSERPDQGETATTIARVFHTLAGSAAALGHRALSELAHEGERFLGRWREGRIPTEEERDAVEKLLTLSEASLLSDAVPPHAELSEKLARLAGDRPG